jgi:hypothetical protein
VDGLQAFARGRATSIVCMDGLDLTQILSGGLSLIDVIQRKKRRAVENRQLLRAGARPLPQRPVTRGGK